MQSPVIPATDLLHDDMPVYEDDSNCLQLVDDQLPFDETNQFHDPNTLIPFSSLWTVTNTTVPIDIEPAIDIDPSLFNTQLPPHNDRNEVALDGEDIFGGFNADDHDQFGVDISSNIFRSFALSHKPLTKHLQTYGPSIYSPRAKSLLTRPPFLGHQWRYVHYPAYCLKSHINSPS
jgi:hypothetical protein